MKDYQLMTLLVAFLLGYFSNQIMMNMCDDNLVEGSDTKETNWEKYGWILWAVLFIHVLVVCAVGTYRFIEGIPILSYGGDIVVDSSQVPLPNPEPP